MQPYFVPYAGYYSLIAACDLFVLFDCVQFPRRGWLHRNCLPDALGRPAWLTLPLEKAPVSTIISDLRFRRSAAEELRAQIPRFPSLADGAQRDRELMSALLDLSLDPVDYLERMLSLTCERLGLTFRTQRSSTLALPDDLVGQQRVIAIARAFGADCYVNLSGGHALYDRRVFAQNGIRLEFLDAYTGSRWSILHRLLSEPHHDLAREVRDNARTAAQ